MATIITSIILIECNPILSGQIWWLFSVCVRESSVWLYMFNAERQTRVDSLSIMVTDRTNRMVAQLQSLEQIVGEERAVKLYA